MQLGKSNGMLDQRGRTERARISEGEELRTWKIELPVWWMLGHRACSHPAGYIELFAAARVGGGKTECLEHLDSVQSIPPQTLATWHTTSA